MITIISKFIMLNHVHCAQKILHVIWLADKISIFGWNLAEPQKKFGGGAAHDIKLRRGAGV